MHLECHVMPNGKKCRATDLRHLPYCYFHTRLHRLALQKNSSAKAPLDLPALEDRSAIQLALGQILNALVSERIDPKRAGLLLYGLQIASQIVPEDVPAFPVTTAPSITHTRDGQELASPQFACDMPRDCKICPGGETCILHRAYIGLNGGVDPADEDEPGNDAEDEDGS